MFVHRFLCENKFHFFRINPQECNQQIAYDILMFRFLKKCLKYLFILLPISKWIVLFTLSFKGSL